MLVSRMRAGKSRTFKDVAKTLMQVYGECPIEYIPFEGRYQHFTEADLSDLSKLGFEGSMTELEAGIMETCQTLAATGD